MQLVVTVQSILNENVVTVSGVKDSLLDRLNDFFLILCIFLIAYQLHGGFPGADEQETEAVREECEEP